MSATVLMNASCPHCTGPVTMKVTRGEPFPCPNCGNTVMVPEGQNKMIKVTQENEGQSGGISVQAGGDVNFHGKVAAGDMFVTNYNPPSSDSEAVKLPEADEGELLAALVPELGLKCPHCNAAVDEDGKLGKKYVCGVCGKKAFITTDGKIMTWLAAVQQGLNLSLTTKTAAAPDLGGDGRGVNIDAGDGNVDVPGDVIGGFKI